MTTFNIHIPVTVKEQGQPPQERYVIVAVEAASVTEALERVGKAISDISEKGAIGP